MRRVDEVVAALEKFIAEPVFDDFADEATFGMPENEAGAGFFLNAKEVKLCAEFAMIAALGFFEAI